jgi:hypothetical protein
MDETFGELLSPHPNIVTAEGLAAIEAALARLPQEYAVAQTSGDRAALAALSREMRYWTSPQSVGPSNCYATRSYEGSVWLHGDHPEG